MFIYQEQGTKKIIPPLKDAEGEKKSSIAAHASWILRPKQFPSIDSNGAVYTSTAGLVGKQSEKSREILEPSALNKHLEEHFPQRFVITAGPKPPWLRAAKYKEAATSRKTMLAFRLKKKDRLFAFNKGKGFGNLHLSVLLLEKRRKYERHHAGFCRITTASCCLEPVPEPLPEHLRG